MEANAMISYENGFILFGGHIGYYLLSKTVARFDLATTSWSKVGDLRAARHGHEVVFLGEVFLVFGGHGNFKTEKCTLSGKEF